MVKGLACDAEFDGARLLSDVSFDGVRLLTDVGGDSWSPCLMLMPGNVSGRSSTASESSVEDEVMLAVSVPDDDCSSGRYSCFSGDELRR